jgi:hypothetical protein
MNNNMNQNNNSQLVADTAETKLAKIKNLLDKGLIDQDDYDKKKDQIISEM